MEDIENRVDRVSYRWELDFLRFGAFLFVFISHTVPSTPGSFLSWGPPLLDWFLIRFSMMGCFGVDLFFMISAFLITELLSAELEKFGKIDILKFLVRRSLRIWPLYFIYLIFVIIGGCLGWFPKVPAYQTGYFGVFLGNWFWAWRGGAPHSLLVHLWSISVEEQFYIGFPFQLYFFGKDRVLRSKPYGRSHNGASLL